jgi:hypothetical protein
MYAKFHEKFLLLCIGLLLLVCNGCGSQTDKSSGEEWGLAPEWVTYQGNASHSGYVAVTLDSTKFSEAWIATIWSGTPLNPVTAGDGNVFVSTNSYFGKQLLAVLDAKNGSLKWSYDFGAIHSVNPPAYSNGRVYVTTGGHSDSFVWCFSADSGDPVFKSAYSNQWSHYFAPTIVDDALYMAGGYYDGAYRFNAINGDQIWFASLNQYDQWTPAIRDGLVYAYTGSYSPKVSVLNVADGSVVYEIPDPNFSWNGWSMNIAPALGSQNDLLATQNNRLISFDLQGRVIRWEQTGTYTGNVTTGNGVLYVINNSQIEARAESDGSLLWVWIAPDGIPTGNIIVTKNLLFVSTDATTYAVNLRTHDQVWSYPKGGQLALSKQGILLISGQDGKVAAIAVKP